MAGLNTQNRDTAPLQIKLDELIHVTAGGHCTLLDPEAMPEEKLDQTRRHYEHLARRARVDTEAAGLARRPLRAVLLR